VSLFEVADLLLSLAFHGFDLGLEDLILPLLLIVLVSQPVTLLLLGLQLKSMSSFHIFGKLQAQDVSINRQCHFGLHALKVTLLYLNLTFHVSQPLFMLIFKLFACLSFLTKASFSQTKPLSQSFIVLFVVFIQSANLVSLS
jgi:hypothetical protein